MLVLVVLLAGWVLLAALDMFLSCSRMLPRSLLTCPPNSSATDRRLYRVCRSCSTVEPGDREGSINLSSHCASSDGSPTLFSIKKASTWFSWVLEVVELYCDSVAAAEAQRMGLEVNPDLLYTFRGLWWELSQIEAYNIFQVSPSLKLYR